jgi:bifunctional UDP-N-acetylglucosamine pyrophosphorylase / glucosamine-1-phosphate N-acetyltransferase
MISKANITSIILAAGNGVRMLSYTPKVLHKIALQPLLEYVLQKSYATTNNTVVVANNHLIEHETYNALKRNYQFQDVVQEIPLGSADAVRCAIQKVDTEYTLILYGDVPFIKQETIIKMQQSDVGLVLLGFECNESNQYGKIILDDNAIPCDILEYKESPALHQVNHLCNAGIMFVKTLLLKEFLEKLKNNHESNEYYLTDLVNFAYNHKNKYKIELIMASTYEEVIGINNKAQLAEAENILQQTLRNELLSNGVILLDPKTVFLNPTVSIAKDVVIHPYVFFGPNVIIETGTTILPFSHLEGVHIKEHCTIGPFARIRPHTIIEMDSRIGNFVELKNATISKNTKASHLSYLGDVTIGENTNIGAGTIFCNYDGRNKHHSTVGQNSFIGSNTAIISPVCIGENVTIGAGSVITQDVPNRHIALSRATQQNKLKAQ